MGGRDGEFGTVVGSHVIEGAKQLTVITSEGQTLPARRIQAPALSRARPNRRSKGRIALELRLAHATGADRSHPIPVRAPVLAFRSMLSPSSRRLGRSPSLGTTYIMSEVYSDAVDESPIRSLLRRKNAERMQSGCSAPPASRSMPLGAILHALGFRGEEIVQLVEDGL
jgi:hypothetical protein